MRTLTLLVLAASLPLLSASSEAQTAPRLGGRSRSSPTSPITTAPQTQCVLGVCSTAGPLIGSSVFNTGTGIVMTLTTTTTSSTSTTSTTATTTTTTSSTSTTT